MDNVSAPSPVQQRFFSAILMVFFTVIALPSAAEDQGNSPIRIDGFVALLDERSLGGGELSPILLSDIDFEATVMLLEEGGGEGSSPSKVIWQKALRRAVLIRLLTRQAKRLNEVVDKREVDALVKAITARAGGKKQIEHLLSRFGLSEDYLAMWAEDTLLAAAQIQAFADQGEQKDIQSWIESLIGDHRVRMIR